MGTKQQKGSRWKDWAWTTYTTSHQPAPFIASHTDAEELKARVYAPRGQDPALQDMDSYTSSPGNLSIINQEQNSDAHYRCLYLKRHKLPPDVVDAVGNAPVVFANERKQRPNTSWALAAQALWVLMAPAFKTAGLRNVRFVFSNTNGSHYLHVASDQEGKQHLGRKARAFHKVAETPLADDAIRLRLAKGTTGRTVFKLAGHLGDALITNASADREEIRNASIAALTGLMMEMMDVSK